MFNENFSFGLVYFPKHEKGSLELVRCNGQHGEHKQYPHHIFYHIHKANSNSIENGLKEDCEIEITEKYSTLEEAFRFFIKYINVAEKNFNEIFSTKLPTLFE